MATDEILNANLTTSSGMAPLMEAILNRYVRENKTTERKYTQFGQKVSIPKGKTKTIAFDKVSPLPKAIVPLTEGVTPRGEALHITRIKGEPDQYGNYVTYTDQLDFYANDPSPEVLKYTDLLKENQVETYEYIDSLELSSGTNVLYAGTATSRSTLADVLTVKDIRRAATQLARNKIKKADGTDYIAFVHPDVVYNIWSDEEWQKPNTYADATAIYSGEVGRLFGVRFIQDPEAVVFRAYKFEDKYPELSIIKVDAAGKKIYVAETITTTSSYTSKKILIDNIRYTITSATAGSNGNGYLTITESLTNAFVEPDMKIYPDGAGSGGKPVYSTIVIGANAFGTSGDDNTEMINKALGSAGTADPLNQRGTYGWKGDHFFKIIEQQALVRIESLASVD